VDSSGRLELSDTEKLTAAISSDADAVQSLFASADGVGTRMLERVERYTASDGILSRRKQGIDRSVRRLDDRIDRFDARLERRRERLQEQFAELQKLQQQLQGQGFF
jgi:flagellar hook-associated protein 2